MKWMQKVQERMGKLVDLVCTRGFFLYKSGQVRPNIQQVPTSVLLTSLLLLVAVWTPWQAWPNATKCGQMEMTFADAPL